ncbi:hypothetical protein BGP77_12120 [Saccharospirillum sp. MSK14-1]|uniref:immunity 70 family protein n=1 Tax=Saccharospirillum sp. MSK14-1 TaxID=1897632 RepID=UPI000D335DAD|nr:immunity 70 family protein [Saccharospirillum sp. MSK14-1]PTY38449.1 hypothetical protein BGP77_12120 [Saccharospirillum sp. MSK14-1]
MSVGLKIGSINTEIGSADFLHAFFSTVSYRLESDGWGSRFPVIMNELFQGQLDAAHVDAAIVELDSIQEELKSFKPKDVIWDIYNLDAKPPWGDNISARITDLSNYFVTSNGSDLIEVMRDRFNRLKLKGTFLEIAGVGLVGKRR